MVIYNFNVRNVTLVANLMVFDRCALCHNAMLRMGSSQPMTTSTSHRGNYDINEVYRLSFVMVILLTENKVIVSLRPKHEQKRKMLYLYLGTTISTYEFLFTIYIHRNENIVAIKLMTIVIMLLSALMFHYKGHDPK